MANNNISGVHKQHLHFLYQI